MDSEVGLPAVQGFESVGATHIPDAQGDYSAAPMLSLLPGSGDLQGGSSSARCPRLDF